MVFSPPERSYLYLVYRYREVIVYREVLYRQDLVTLTLIVSFEYVSVSGITEIKDMNFSRTL